MTKKQDSSENIEAEKPKTSVKKRSKKEVASKSAQQNNSSADEAFFFLQASEQYLTSAQLLAHFFRQLNGLPQTKQVLLGRSDFLISLHRFNEKSTTRPNIINFNISHFIKGIINHSKSIILC